MLFEDLDNFCVCVHSPLVSVVLVALEEFLWMKINVTMSSELVGTNFHTMNPTQTSVTTGLYAEFGKGRFNLSGKIVLV